MSKGTTPRAIRIDDDLWEAAKSATHDKGDTISEVVRRALVEYVRKHQETNEEP